MNKNSSIGNSRCRFGVLNFLFVVSFHRLPQIRFLLRMGLCMFADKITLNVMVDHKRRNRMHMTTWNKGVSASYSNQLKCVCRRYSAQREIVSHKIPIQIYWCATETNKKYLCKLLIPATCEFCHSVVSHTRHVKFVFSFLAPKLNGNVRSVRSAWKVEKGLPRRNKVKHKTHLIWMDGISIDTHQN